MKAKTKKKLLVWACVLVVLTAFGFFGYRFALEYLGGHAMKKIISSEINTMLDTGEVTIEEIEEIIAEPEKEKVPSASSAPKKKEEVVQKAAEKVSEEVTRDDKREIMRLIGARLTKEDVNQLMAMAKDGLTDIEIRDAARIARARFTPEEIEQVKSFWHKYKNSVKKKK